jgi:predicted solute-binding protein
MSDRIKLIVGNQTSQISPPVRLGLKVGSVQISNIDNPPYNLPIASNITLGGVRVGANLSVSANGVLSANIPASITNWNELANKPTTFAPANHTHNAVDVIGLANIAKSGQYSDIVNKPATFPSDWANVTNKPTTFAPTAHNQAISTITGLQAELDGKLTVVAGNAAYAVKVHNHTANQVSGLANVAISGSYNDLTNKPTTVSSDWANITGKPLTFAPANHTQDWGTITGKPTSFTPSAHNHTANQVSGLANVAISGSYADLLDKPTTVSSDWANITGKPLTFAPSAHNQTIATITGLQTALDGKQSTGNYVLATDSRLTDSRAPLSHTQAISTVIGLQTALDGKQAAGSYVSANDARLTDARTPLSHTHQATQITGLSIVATSGSYTDLTNKPTAVSSDWANITGKPSTFTPSAHTHQIADTVGLRTDLDSRLTQTQADARYKLISATTDWGNITSKPTTFAPSAHTHVIANVTGLQTSLDSKLIQSAADIRYAAISHTHPVSAISGLAAVATTGSYNDLTNKPTAVSTDWANITGKPTTFTPSAHNHTIANVTGLQTALDGKQASGAYVLTTDSRLSDARTPLTHNQAISTIIDLQTSLDSKLTQTQGDLRYPLKTALATVATTGSYTDLANKPTSFASDWANITNKPSTFAPSAHNQTISTITGLQTALDGKQATGNYVLTTDTRLGDARTPLAHNHTANQVTGLATVATTGSYSDLANKPTSFASDWANITNKPSTFAPSAHNHTIANVTGLQTALDGKSSLTHVHAISAITSLQSALDSKLTVAQANSYYAVIAHSHAWSEITGKPTLFAPAAHTQDWTTITNRPTTFTPSAHTHNTTDITGLDNTLSNFLTYANATQMFKGIGYTPDWTAITSKPSVFPPETHAHEYSAIANKPTSFTPPIATTSVLGGVRALYNGNITIDASGYINANIPTGGLTTTEADAKYVIANATTNSLPFIRRSAGFGGTACMTLNNFGSLYTQLSYAGASTLITQTSTCCTLTGITNWVDDSILTLGKALSTFALIGSGSGGGNTTVTWTTLSGKPSTFTPPIATTDVLGGVMVGAGLTVDSCGTLSATPNWANITGKPSTFVPPVANLTVLGGIKPGYGVTVSSDGTLDVTVSAGNGTGTATSIAWANITSKPTSFTPPIATASVLGGVIPSGNITVNGSGQIDVAIPSTVTWSTLSGKPSTFEPTIATASVVGGVKPGTGLSVAADGTLNCTITGSSGAVQTTATGSTLEILDRSGANLYYSMTYSDSTGVTHLLDDGDYLTKLTLGPRSLTATGINNWQDSSLLTRSYGDGRYMPISGSVGTVSVDWANITGKPTIFVPGNSTSLVDNIFDTANGFAYTLPDALGGPATGGIGVTTNSAGGVGLSARSNTDNRNAAVFEVSPSQWDAGVQGDSGANLSYLVLTKNDLYLTQQYGVKTWGDSSLLTRSYADGRYPSKTEADAKYLPLGNWTNTTLSAVSNLQRSFGAVGSAYTGVIGVGTTTGQVRILTKNNTGDATSQIAVTAGFVATTVAPSTGNSTSTSVSGEAFSSLIIASGLTRSNLRVSQASLFHKFDSVSLPDAANGTGTVMLEFFPEGTFRITDPYGNGFKYDPTSKSLAVNETGVDPVPVDKSYIIRKYADARYQAIGSYLTPANLTYANITGKPTLATVATTGSYTDLSNTPASYSLPTATTSVLGGVKVDGSTITISSGVISAVSSSYTLPMATSSTLGGVRIGSGISVDQGNGFLNTDVRLTTNTFTGTQNLGGNLLTQPKLQAYRETSTAPTISSGTLTLDLSGSNFFAVSLNAAITTLTISNTPSSSAASFTLELTADGTARAVTWGSAIKWSGGTAPTLTSTSGKKDVFAFYSNDGGTSWQGFIGGQNF